MLATAALNTFPAPFAIFELTPELHNMWRFASMDETRHSLSFIEVCKRGDHWFAVATDGHRLAKVRLTMTGATITTDCFHIPAAALKALKVKRGAKVVVEVKRGSVTFTGDAGTPSTPIDETPRFPEWEQVIPSPNTGDAAKCIGVNPRYLADIGDYAIKCGHKSNGIAIEMPADDLSPIRVTVGGMDDSVFVVMPMRI